MTIQELKKRIKENDIPKFLIFTGPEYTVQKIYIEQIAKVKNLVEAYDYDSITEFWNILDTQSLFGTSKLYVVYDDKELMTNEKIYSQLETKLKDNMLILVLTSVDKRLKILKQYKDSIVEFNTLNKAILKQYIQKEIALSDRNCEILMEITNYNYGHCLLEIDKIKRYMRYKGTDDIEDHNFYNSTFDKFLEDGILYVPPRDTLWDFIKAFLQNKPLHAYELYQDLKELETPTFSILTNLYNNAKAIFQVQTCKSDNVEKSTGLTSWQIRNAKECVGRISNGDLAYLMRLIHRVDSGIKQGKIDESVAIDYIFTSFF